MRKQFNACSYKESEEERGGLVSKFNLGGGGEEILCHSTLRCAIAR